ncbi:MAG TPA: ribose-phosphate pyrophosphokinase [Armatimonadetes bacterium]|mgnify:CR=1 FL=1|jgi:ribose-phosphate pyrophosphokinase|nr:ribose-phosphate pyrophosphokinase [Armatimonadota bacterium]
MAHQTLYDIPDCLEELEVFCGSSHPQLARDICACLDIPLGETFIDRFANDNIYVQIRENVREKDIYVVQTAAPPVSEHLMELFLMVDALKHASARRVTVVMPYYAYVRSDKKDAPRISVAARLVADLLEAAGADRILTMNLHSEQVQGFFRCPTDHLTAVPILCDYFTENVVDLSDYVVISPDAGSAKRAGRYAERLGLPLAIGDKRRDGKQKDHAVVDQIVGDVNGKNVIIFDDEIATAGSMISLAQVIREKYDVGRILAGAAHGVLVGPAIERLAASEIEQIVVTDSLPLPPEKQIDKIKQVPVAPLLASAIYAIHTGESVSSLFR